MRMFLGGGETATRRVDRAMQEARSFAQSALCRCYFLSIPDQHKDKAQSKPKNTRWFGHYRQRCVACIRCKIGYVLRACENGLGPEVPSVILRRKALAWN